jgi:hypothetical protein
VVYSVDIGWVVLSLRFSSGKKSPKRKKTNFEKIEKVQESILNRAKKTKGNINSNHIQYRGKFLNKDREVNCNRQLNFSKFEPSKSEKSKNLVEEKSGFINLGGSNPSVSETEDFQTFEQALHE